MLARLLIRGRLCFCVGGADHDSRKRAQTRCLAFPALMTFFTGGPCPQPPLSCLRALPRLGQRRPWPCNSCLKVRSRGERGLYITLSETQQELRRGGGLPRLVNSGDAIRRFRAGTAREASSTKVNSQSLLYSSDLELGETTSRVLKQWSDYQARRALIDSLSEIRLLAQSSLRYRRQILALKHCLAQHDVTVLLLDDMTAELQTRQFTVLPTG